MNRYRRRQFKLTRTPQARHHRPDYWLLILSAVLLAIGLVVVYAISPALSIQNHVGSNYFINRQLIAVGMGLVAFVIVASIPVTVWQRLRTPLFVIAGLATLAAIASPITAAYPAHRWIRLGGLSLQSVEILKFALLVCLAVLLADAMKNNIRQNSTKIIKVLIVVLGLLGLVVALLQKDLGSTVVVVAMMTAMCFVAGLPMKRLMVIGGVLIVGAILVILPFSYRRERLLTFVHPTSDCQNTGYQACQALIGVGSGGMIGLGLGRSVQAYGYLPEASSDSIFAIYAEKFGFIGVVILLGLFTALFTRLKSIVERAPDDYTRLLVTGILAWFSTQAFINIGSMAGLLPLKGITLPFISYGGTSVVFVMAAIGLAFRISGYTLYSVPAYSNAEGKRYDGNRPSRWRLRGAHNPSARSRS